MLKMLAVAAPLVATLVSALETGKEARQFQLAAESSDFWKLIDRDARLSSIASGFGFTEGPVWDESGFLYVSDEIQNKIYRVYPNGQKDSVISLGDPDGNTLSITQF